MSYTQKKTFVYILDFTNYVKVGYSSKVWNRKRQIEYDISKVARHWCYVAGDRKLEEEMHKRLEQYHKIDEFYDIDFKSAVSLLKELSKNDDIAIYPYTESRGRWLYDPSLGQLALSLCRQHGESTNSLADKIGMNSQTFARALTLNTLSTEDFQAIVHVLGYKLQVVLTNNNGHEEHYSLE